MIDLVLDCPGLESGRFLAVGMSVGIQRLDHHAVGSGDIRIDLRYREAALLGPGPSLRFHYARVHHYEAILVHINYGNPPGDTHLVGGEPDALGSIHGLEHVGNQPLHLIIDRVYRLTVLAQHRRSQQVQIQQTHVAAGPGAAALLPTRTMRDRSTTTVEVPLSTVTRTSFSPSASISLISRTRPMIPPLVITSSPFFSLVSSSAWRLRACPEGRRIRK